MKNYDLALEDADVSLIIDPNDSSAWDLRATAYQGLGDIDQAIADWEKALEIEPDNADIRANLAKAKQAKAAAGGR